MDEAVSIASRERTTQLIELFAWMDSGVTMTGISFYLSFSTSGVSFGCVVKISRVLARVWHSNCREVM